MRRWIARLLIPAAGTFAPAAHAAIACSMAITPAPITGIYSSTANLNLPARLDLTCTRDPANDPRRADIWIGISQGPSGNVMTRDTGGSTLAYALYRKAYGSGLWTDTGSQNPNQNGTGALADSIDFGQTGATFTGFYDIFFQAPLGQTTAGAGVYLDPAVAVTMRRTDQTGPVLATTTLGARVSIPKSCRFSTDPSPISVVYPAFTATPVIGQSNFALTCTQGTSYTLSLDRTRSVIPTIELAYDLSLSAAASTGTAVVQPYTVDISVDAGQAGRCSGSTCNGTDTRTITITY